MTEALPATPCAYCGRSDQPLTVIFSPEELKRLTVCADARPCADACARRAKSGGRE